MLTRKLFSKNSRHILYKSQWGDRVKFPKYLENCSVPKIK